MVQGQGLQRQVAGWLQDDGWKVSTFDSGSASWRLSAEDGRGRTIVVGRLEGQRDVLKIVGQSSLDDALTGEVGRFPRRDSLIYEIRFELLRLGLDFSGVEVPLRRILMHRNIYIDDTTTQDSFSRRVGDVRRGILVVRWLLEREGLLHSEE